MPDDHPSSDAKLVAFCEKLLALLLTANGGVKERLIFFIGAGCSREYGIPTTRQLAREFLSGSRGGLSDEERRGLDDLDVDELFELFLSKFQTENSIDIQRRFFDDVIEECRRRADQKSHVYEMLVDLWRNGFIELVITTNFDHLIEDVADDVTVLDYHDIAAKIKPQSLEGLVLVKVAGDVRRSKMLWTASDFAENVTDDVIRWLIGRTSLKPIVLVGYRANEAEMRRVLLANEREMFVVFPGRLDDALDLASAARTKRGSTYHSSTTASEFLVELTEGIYARSNRESLLFSFQALRKKLRTIVYEYPGAPEDDTYVARSALDAAISDHIEAASADRRILVLLGDSGNGKTHALKRLALTCRSEVAVAYVAAHEIPTRGLSAWFDRIRGLALDSVCELSTQKDRRLAIVLDGLNEIDDSRRALAILGEAIAILDKYDSNVTLVVSSRPEFWGNLAHVLQRRQWSNVFELGHFTEAECIEGLRKLGVDLDARALAKHPAREVLAVPMFQHFISELNIERLESVTPYNLFDAFYERKVVVRPQAWRRVLFKFCRQIHQRNALAVADFADSLRHGEEEGLGGLTENDILIENDSAKVSFRNDIFAEYTFARLYLQDALFADIESDWPHEVFPFLRRLIDEWRAISPERLSYKVFFLGALKFFVAMRTDSQIDELLSSGDEPIAQLAKDAIYSRKDLTFSPAHAGDAFLASVAMHRRDNYGPLLDAIERSAGRGPTFPLNIASKLFPATLLDFLQYIAREVSRSEARSPLPLRVLLHGLLIYSIRNGRDDGRRRAQLLRILATISRLADVDSVAANIEQTLLESSRYLLYSDSASRLSDISELDVFYKELLGRALHGSVFDLTPDDISNLLRRNMVTWIVTMFLLLRDRADAQLGPVLETIFGEGDVRAQDFVITVYGHLAKLDARYEETLKRYTLRIKDEYPEIFYATSPDPDSQYDPLVPYVSTQILNHPGEPLDLPGMELSDRYFERCARLFYKLCVDFPAETLRTIYGLHEKDVDIYARFGNTLKTVQKFHPDVFWALAKRYMIDDCFRPEFESAPWEPKSVRQLRDWDWFRIFDWILGSEKSIRFTERAIEHAMNARSFNAFVRSLLSGRDDKRRKPRSTQPHM